MKRKNQLKKIKNISKLYTNFFFFSNYKLIYFYNFLFWNKILHFSKYKNFNSLFNTQLNFFKNQLISLTIYNLNVKIFLLNFFFFNLARNFYYLQILLIFFI